MVTKSPRKILFAAMDWGLGHATRSVQLIRNLQSEGHDLTLASAGTALAFWKNYFPELKIIEKPGYSINYHRFLPLSLGLLLKSSSIFKIIRKEHLWLEKINQVEIFDEVYSDNCYGLYNRNLISTIITHQMMIKCPKPFQFFETFLHRKILSWTNNFDHCLIPDFESSDNLSGDLSHQFPLPSNAEFIGPLSRFSLMNLSETTTPIEPIYYYCAIVSGPEPYRSRFEEKCIEVILKSGKPGVLIRGLPNKKNSLEIEGIEIYNHLADYLFAEKILQSEVILSRSGYSTIMDLYVLGKEAIYFPTPGQTEQEYLLKHNLNYQTMKKD